MKPIAVVKLERAKPVLYDKDIEPILVNKCAVCHSDNIKEGKLDMGTYEALIKGGKRGAPIVPGKSADSLLIKLVGTSREEVHAAQGRGAADAGGTGPDQTVDRPGRQGADHAGANGPRSSSPARPPTSIPCSASPSAPTRSKSPPRAATRSTSTTPPPASISARCSIRNWSRPTRSRSRPPICRSSSRWPTVPTAKRSPPARFRKSCSGTRDKGTIRQRLTGFADRVVALDFSHDGKLLATGGGAPTEDGEIKIFDVASGKLVVDIKNGHSDTVFGVSFSPDDKKLATCAADKFVKMFEMPSGKFVKSFEGHTHHVLDVGWKADGKLLASAGADNAIKIWDFEKGEQVRTINGHGKQVTRLLFIGKTDQFATCSGDQTVRFWNINGGTTRNFGGSADFLYALGVSPDGALVAAGGQEGIVRVYNGTNGQLLKSLLPPDAQPPATPKKK